MMTCEQILKLLGPYFDGEVTADIRIDMEAHLATCPACSHELDGLHDFAAQLAEPQHVSVPPSLWDAIDRRLSEQRDSRRSTTGGGLGSRVVWAVAASAAIVVGLGLFGLIWGGDGSSQANAATVDFTLLLDSLQSDAPAAFEKFLSQYNAIQITASTAKSRAPKLDFDLPQVLPGGFTLQAVYSLGFGDEPGVAARYERNGDFLGALFHPPVLKEDFGTHKDRSCIVGQHRGHKVPVGEWSLVHLADPTTCHCVLSRLDEMTELPAVMALLAPRASTALGGSHNHDAGSP